MEKPWVIQTEDDELMGNRFISLLQQEPVNTAWGMKLLCSLVLWHRIPLYL